MVRSTLLEDTLYRVTYCSPDEGEAHLMELSKLAEKDPEFFKYLQENDRELLEFNTNAGQAGDDDEDEEEVMEDVTPVLTKEILQRWQKALLDVCPSAFLFDLITHMKWILASVIEGPEEDVDRFPVRGSHERRGPSGRMEDRPLVRYAPQD